MSSSRASAATDRPTPTHGRPPCAAGSRSGPRPNPKPAASGSSHQALSISLNGEARTVDEGLTVAVLLEQLELRPGMVVVERNRKVLPRSSLEHVPVEEGDEIEIVHFVGGG